ncbi:hypothetical protein [Kitasatospora sp. NPDC088783]
MAEAIHDQFAARHCLPGSPYGQDAFTTPRDHEQVTCLNGVTSTQWHQ